MILGAWVYLVRPFRTADIPRDAGALVLLDRDGGTLGTILGRDDRHTFAVPHDRMGRWFLPALVAAEDGRFEAHGALDPFASLRAFADGLRTHRVPSGASTIEMQLARTLATMPAGWRGKVAETLLAMRIENGMSKRDILEAYANRAPMGANLYGVEAAARTYFGESAAQLDLAQSAMLAALPNAPSALDPHAHAVALHARARYVLGRMRALGFIDAADEATVSREDIDVRAPSFALRAPQFCFFAAARTPVEVDRVRTTIDPELQRFVQENVRAVVQALGPNDVHQAAAIVIENRTAAVRAYVGSVAYDDRDLGRNDGVQALRQPGSALKPFLYELAFERRVVRPYDILADVPTSYALPGARLYSPTDYSQRFLGPVRPRIALADSLNVPAVRVLERTGVAPFLDRLRALGFSHLDRAPEYYGLGLTLGGGEVSLWELARAYLAMARDGAATSLVTVDDDVDGRVSSADRGGAQFLGGDGAPLQPDAPAWAEVTDMLADRHARAASFGVDSILALPYAAAVKTGTSSDFRDTWTVGFSRDYTVAVWVGNFDGHPMHEISGVTGAGPIWSRIMQHLHEHSEPAPFDPPRGFVRTAMCTTQPRLWHADCARAYEWLDGADVAMLARTRQPVALGAEFDSWLALQPVSRRDGMGARIAYPRDGDVFVAAPASRGGDAFDVQFATSDRARARLLLDGVRIKPRGDGFVVPLVVGEHALLLEAGDGTSRIHFSVVARGVPARRGFTVGRRGGVGGVR